uniref:RNA polymerase II elongation factor ELL n=1 Tax=Bactrocera latifrons TaxID=174628 RepID=A0A0K8UEY5_BACLA
MAPQNVAKHINRSYNGRRAAKKIHPISTSWNMNQSRGNGINLFLKEKSQAGVKSQPEVNTKIENDKLLNISSRKFRERLPVPSSSIQLTPDSIESPSSTYSNSPPELVKNNHVKGYSTSKRSTVNDDEPQPTKKMRMEHSTVDKCTDSLRSTSPSPITNIDVIQPPVYDFSDYTEITNNEQRQQYKAAFHRYYKEYMPLYQQTTELRSSFRELGGLIIDMPKNCPEYEIINQRILAKFQILNSREQLQRQMRCDYLHDKLEHIKELVTSYDRKRTKEMAMAFAKAMAKEYELRQQLLKTKTDVAETVVITEPYGSSSANEDEAATKPDEEIPPTTQEYIGNILVNDLALSDSDSDDD